MRYAIIFLFLAGCNLPPPPLYPYAPQRVVVIEDEDDDIDPETTAILRGIQRNTDPLNPGNSRGPGIYVPQGYRPAYVPAYMRGY